MMNIIAVLRLHTLEFDTLSPGLETFCPFLTFVWTALPSSRTSTSAVPGITAELASHVLRGQEDCSFCCRRREG
ncbi:hypothetical protein JZ751_005686 [Albula glossodonta]|uniref:Uncharacterized protein n=1 Tax=Albula glossodonta TaxID=121402 RepID=A0A8T2N4I8_9TELE|nr:hypothetical protein JZ751_005686 [Albula glossodonta]